MNKWKIYFLLFGFALCCGLFGILSKNAFAVESYKISPADDRTITSRFYENSGIAESRKIDLHYYFYANNQYGEQLNGIAYICDYKTDRYAEEVKTITPCGLSMVQEAGKFKIKINAGYYLKFTYSRKTQKVNEDYLYVYDVYNNGDYELQSFTDKDFDNGLTLLGGSTLLANNWNRNEGGFLIEPVGGSSNNSNNNGGFDILGGIKAFFQPMIDSVVKMWQILTNITDNILKGIGEFFKPMVDSVANILKAVSHFVFDLLDGFKKMFGGFLDSFVGLFVPTQGQIDTELSNIKAMFSFQNITNVLNTTYLPLDKVGFTYGSQCDNAYWDSTVNNHLAPFYATGGQKYAKGFSLVTSICKVPKIYITLARNLFMFAFFWWSAYRLFQMVPIVMGSMYVWDRWKRSEG